MTLVIAVICKDGIVMGSDSHIANADDTKGEGRKIHRLGTSGLIGWAGEYEIAQKSIVILEKQAKTVQDTGLSDAVVKKMRTSLVRMVRSEIGLRSGIEGDPEIVADRYIGANMLIAASGPDGKAKLLHIGPTCRAEFEDETGYSAIGSGSTLAFPQMQNMAERFSMRDMDSEDTMKIVYRAIREVSKRSDTVGGPVDMWVAGNDGRVTHVDKVKIAELEQFYQGWMKLEASLFEHIRKMRGGVGTVLLRSDRPAAREKADLGGTRSTSGRQRSVG